MEREKRTVAGAIMISTFLAAFDVTVLATAAPTIAADLGGFAMSSWIFTMYLFFSALSTPLYGKLADLYGRKKVLMAGIILFMAALVVWRSVQGLGTGSIFTINFTIIGDLYTLKERAVVQGGISTVWGVAGLVGPVLGGLFIDFLSWHWVFFVNIPFCILCIAVFQRYLKETKRLQKPVIDYAGSFFLTIAIGALLYALMIGYEQGTAVYALILAIVAGVAFRLSEKKAVEPIIPQGVLTRPMVLNLVVTLAMSIVLIALNVYIPAWLQQVLLCNATLSGLALAAMSSTWTISSFSMERVLHFLGLRKAVCLSCLIIAVAAAALSQWGNQSYGMAVGISALFGFGFSGVMTLLMFMIQDAVPYEKRGAAVGLGTLTRSIGQTLGMAIFGTFLNIGVALYEPASGLQMALSVTYDAMYAVIAVVAIGAAILSIFLPKYHEIHR